MASIHKRTLSDGKAARWDAFWRDQTGRQHKRTFKRRKDADAWLTEARKEVQDGTFQEVNAKPMEEVFDLWLANQLEVRIASGDIKPSTANVYRCLVRGFKREFGAYRSDRLTPAAAEEWRLKIARRIGNGQLSKKSYNNAHNLLANILSWAREPARGYLKHDPLAGVRRMQISKSERALSQRDFLETDEISALLAATSKSEEDVVVHLALFCGLRRGEIFALKWADIDEGHNGSGRIQVRRAISAGQLTTPKTGNSVRTVDVASDVHAALKRHRDADPIDDEFVLHAPAGGRVDADNWYSRVWCKLRDRAGIRNSVGLHSLRHTFASLLIDQGESIHYVKEQMGHSSAAFTLDVYGHLFRKTSDRAMGRLQNTIRAAKRQRFGVVEGAAR